MMQISNWLIHAVRYLGDHFNTKGDNFDLCTERNVKVKGKIIELYFLSKGLNFGSRNRKLSLTLQNVFILRLILIQL